MDDFNTIRLKKKVIEKFKEYSKKTSPSYSETLDYMIAFFEDTGLSPYDTMHNPILSYTRALSKRTKADKLIDSYSKELDKNKKELYDVKNEFSNLLNELTYIKSTFSKSYYRLDISEEKIEDIKSNFF